MGGPGSGPQKTPALFIKDAKEKDAKNLPQYFQKLSAMALGGDREALFYMINRHLGLAKAVAGFDEEDRELLEASVMAQIFTLMAQKRKELTGGKDAIERPGETEGSQ